MIWHINHYLKVPLPAALKSAPALTKIPFVRWLPGTRYQSPHATTPIKLSGVTGVLLHFKFLADFYARVNIQLNRKEHRGDGIWVTELERYRNKLKQNPSLRLRYPGSVGYEGSEQLLRLGLLKEDQQWRRIRTIADDTRHDESRGLRLDPFGSSKVPAS